jgi:predicted AAA+ superfamily ATPase
MIHRIINTSKSQSFFIFGARGTGKSTYIKKQFSASFHYINLLEDRWESRYARNPDLLINDLSVIKPKPHWVVIDEVQKVPKILDIVHELIESAGFKFILTGSSARKLKRGSANLLAGRAFNYHMFPLTHLELKNDFDLDFVLQWGALPKIFSLSGEDRSEYLRSYCQTYLKEEILQEQIVRNGGAFRNFLEIAAQENGKALNFSKIARDADIDTKTAQSFFQILEDTLVGFYLPAFHRSTRKSLKHQPKFYIFDLGVKKAIERSLQQKIVPKTAAYGQAFEHFIICESFRLNSYFRWDFALSHYQTTAGGELDLVLHRGRMTIAIEIKSSSSIDPVEVRKVARVAEGLKPNKIFFLSQDPVETSIDGVNCLPWQRFFEVLAELGAS